MSRLDDVLAIARQLPVFPCRAAALGRYKAKTPLTEHGFLDASQDVDQVCAWYEQFPGCLWGIPTGSRSKIVAIDYDPDKTTPVTDEWIQEHTDALMSTRTHTTARNGRHYVFKASNGAMYSSGASVTLGGKKRPGLDIRGEGGYIIWWPLQGLEELNSAAELPADLLSERSFHAPSAPRPQLPPSPAQWARDQPIAVAALAWLDPADYDSWVRVGMSLHHASQGSDEGFTLWHDWSAGGITGDMPHSYSGIDSCRDKWDGFGKRINGPVRTIASLLAEAKEAGWVRAPAPVAEPTLEPATERKMSHFTNTDMANAVRMARAHGRNIRYVKEGKWLIWDDRRWLIDERGVAIQGLAKEAAALIYDEIKTAAEPKEMFAHARRSQSKAGIEAMVTLARSESGILCRFADFDANPWLLNCNNGTIDLRTGVLHPHKRENHITKIVDISYDPTASFELWDQFLQYITLCDDSLYQYLKRLIGYCLTGGTAEQVLHFLFGIGANGKSVFCEVLSDLMGDYSIIVSPEMVMQKRHQGIPNDIARLRGVRLAMMNETSQGARFDEAKLKDLTGSDSLTARFLNAEFFDFKPTHKLIIRGNHKPVISGTDEGIWRRLRLVPFLAQVPSDEQDRLLINKLREELPGILHWAVQGCLEWQRDGLKPPASILEAVKEYREESDTLGKFLGEHCQLRKNAEVKSSAFFKRYQEYAEASGERWMPSKDLPHEMQRRGFTWRKTMHGNVFGGVELITSESAEHWTDR